MFKKAKLMFNLNVQIEKSELALQLEKTLGTTWDLDTKYLFDAGYDVRACIKSTVVIEPGNRLIVPTGLYFAMEDPHWEIQVRPRSGLAAKYGIMVVNSPGTVDYGYRDQVQVILYNSGDNAFNIAPGDRIAQICFRPVPQVYFKYVAEVPEAILPSEEYEWAREEKRRGKGGFGSTGVK